MKSESGINNRWELLESIIHVPNLKSKFSAYHWYEDNDFRISKDEHWSGWFNDSFSFVSVWAKSAYGKRKLKEIEQKYRENGWSVDVLISNGIGLVYNTMTSEEIHAKAESNLLHGGRMSD